MAKHALKWGFPNYYTHYCHDKYIINHCRNASEEVSGIIDLAIGCDQVDVHSFLDFSCKQCISITNLRR